MNSILKWQIAAHLYVGGVYVYSLADFSPRKSENIRKGYLQGRYGAMPFVGDGIKW